MPDVVLLFHQENCQYCIQLAKIWSSETSNAKNTVLGNFKKIRPDLVFYDCLSSNHQAWISSIPSNLRRLVARVPMLIYVPAANWQASSEYKIDLTKIRVFNNVYVPNIGEIETNFAHPATLEGYTEWFRQVTSGSGNSSTTIYEPPATVVTSSSMLSAINSKPKKPVKTGSCKLKGGRSLGPLR